MEQRELLGEDGGFSVDKAIELPFPTCENLDLRKNGEPWSPPGDYLAQFLPVHFLPIGEAREDGKHEVRIHCVCGVILYGSFLGLSDSFRWGLRNGEGTCDDCGWPTIFYHRFGEDETFSFPLQVHPSLLVTREKEDAVSLG